MSAEGGNEALARHRIPILLAGLLVAVWFAPALAYQERVLVSVTEGSCTLRVEVDEPSHVLRLRVLPEAPACAFTATTVHTVLGTALAQATQEQPAEVIPAIFLGRLVDYPWISLALATFAATDPRWDARKGRPVTGHFNGYVREVLARPGMLAPIDRTLAESGYRVRAVEVEKVLVARCGELGSPDGGLHCPGRVPFDAMVWLVLAKVEEENAGQGAERRLNDN